MTDREEEGLVGKMIVRLIQLNEKIFWGVEVRRKVRKQNYLLIEMDGILSVGIGMYELQSKKSRIRETKHLLTDGESSTDTKRILLMTSWSLLYNLLILVV